MRGTGLEAAVDGTIACIAVHAGIDRVISSFFDFQQSHCKRGYRVLFVQLGVLLVQLGVLLVHVNSTIE